MHIKNKSLTAIIVLMFLSVQTFAHTINYQLEGAPINHVAGYYIALGFQHILPGGLDHILFLVSLFLSAPGFRNMLKISLVFTVAHSVSLILTAMDVITP